VSLFTYPVDTEQFGPVRAWHPVSVKSMVTFAAALAMLGVATVAVEVILAYTAPALLGKDVACGADYCVGIRGKSGVWSAIPAFTLPLAAIFLARALRRGPKAYFEVRQRGLVWGSAWRTRGRPWDQVHALDVHRMVGPSNWLAQLLGWDYRCTIVFTDRKQLTFRSSTADYALLERRVRRYCPTVVQLSPEEQRWRRFRFVWLAIALVLLAIFVVGLLYVASVPDERTIGYRQVPAFSDSQIVLGGGVFGVVFVGFTVSLTAYLLAAPVRRRRR
jgi:hypothetical protein